MNRKSIIVTETDLARLRALLRARRKESTRDHEHLEDLEQELTRAIVVDAADVPDGIVTMNAEVCVREVETGERRTFTLVFPRDADLAAGCLSVLAPLGTALLGYREGDEVEWTMPGGVRRLRIENVRRAECGSMTPAEQTGASASPEPREAA